MGDGVREAVNVNQAALDNVSFALTNLQSCSLNRHVQNRIVGVCDGFRHDRRVEAAVLFATFCPRFSRAERIAISLKATGIILFFALLGAAILSALGVTFPALQAAGGIIFFIIALDMLRKL